MPETEEPRIGQRKPSQLRHHERATGLDNAIRSATLSETSKASMPSVFEAWDLAVQPITARSRQSRLYSLAPIGIGTAFVEGLSGYVMRLADAHAVSTGSFIAKELSRVHLGRANLANLGRFWATINGVGDSAKRWVEGLENLTLRSDLRSLTLLPFERLFAKT